MQLCHSERKRRFKMKREKQRSANFTKNEIIILVDIALQYKSILENKKTDGTTCFEKNKAWETIAEQFSDATGDVSRSSKVLRSKYDSLKKELRKKFYRLRADRSRTGGGLSLTEDLAPYEKKLLSLFQATYNGKNSSHGDADISRIAIEEALPLDDSTCEDSKKEYLESNTEVFLSYLTETKSSATEENSEDNLRPKIDEPAPSTSKISLSPADEREEYTSVHRKRKQSELPRCNTYYGKRKKIRQLCRCGAKNENSRDEEADELKIKLLNLQCQLVEKEIEQKQKIAALQIQNLLLEQKIKEAELKKLL